MPAQDVGEGLTAIGNGSDIIASHESIRTYLGPGMFECDIMIKITE